MVDGEKTRELQNKLIKASKEGIEVLEQMLGESSYRCRSAQKRILEQIILLRTNIAVMEEHQLNMLALTSENPFIHPSLPMEG